MALPKLHPLTSSFMKAWQIHQYGNVKDFVLNTKVKIPTIRKPSDVLIRVEAASINAIDLRMMAAYGANLLNYLRKLDYGQTFSMEFPLTLGRDFSGTVVETGRLVTHLKPGDEVWGATWPHRQGSHAEYCLVPSDALTKKPSNVSHVEASSVPYAGLTAWGALCLTGQITARNAQEKRILVTGGSGGVGSIAIQMLKAWGAEVTTTCSTDAIPLVLSLGVDKVIDYKSTDVETELRATGKYDFILDCVPQNPVNLLSHLKQWAGSTYVTITPPLLKNLDNYGISGGFLRSVGDLSNDCLKGMKTGSSYKWGFFVSSQEGLLLLKNFVENNKVIPVIDKTFEFDDVQNAYIKALEGHVRGKIVIKM